MSIFDYRIPGAILFAVLMVLVISKIGNNLVSPMRHAAVGHGAEATAARGAAPAAPAAPTAKAVAAIEPVAPLLSGANLENGKAKFRLCAACHTPAEGGKNLIGPNLWNVINRSRGAADGFSYSPGMKAIGGAWSYEELNRFLANPKQILPQTKMAFAGLPKPADRADVIAYLRTLSASPAPLP